MDEHGTLKHAVVVIGANTAAMPDEFRRDSRMIFLGPRDAWKIRQQKNARVFIWHNALSRSVIRELEANVDVLRQEVPQKIHLFSVSDIDKMEARIREELQALSGSGGGITADVPPAEPVTLAKGKRNMSKMVREAFEEAQGKLDVIYPLVVAEHPTMSRVAVSGLIYQARKWFERKDPAVLVRIEAAAHNGHPHHEAVPAVPAIPVACPAPVPAAAASVDIQLSKSLRLLHEALVGVAGTIPPIIEAMEAHEEKLRAMDQLTGRLLEATQDVKRAVTGMN